MVLNCMNAYKTISATITTRSTIRRWIHTMTDMKNHANCSLIYNLENTPVGPNSWEYYTQEFTQVATPEENSYIRAYHSIVQCEVIERFEFYSIHHTKAVFYRYYEWYKNHRKNGSLSRISLERFLKERA
jgi:hypothetical protein